ncbi:MAG TPA: nicotinate (nicotinamide) nucleotide adenylyltransferase [Candidatus Dormibacteraeota bacterium]|nr:nicotinate (nicotinamide) nucleotide adenylyltransferase [Candidatus Dormibacteraeota bacterium]
MPRRAVVLGGTFDPIHAGHLGVLEQVRRAARADEAWLLPTGEQPHRGPAHASAEERLAMTEAAAEGRPHVRVLDVEARRPGPSYTVDTLAELEREHPGTEIWLTLGADAAREVPRWHRVENLLDRARFVLVNRTGVPRLDEAEMRALGFDPQRTRLIHVDSPPVSATEIRRRFAAGESVEGMVAPAVAGLIRARGWYGASRDPVG